MASLLDMWGSGGQGGSAFNPKMVQAGMGLMAPGDPYAALANAYGQKNPAVQPQAPGVLQPQTANPQCPPQQPPMPVGAPAIPYGMQIGRQRYPGAY